MPGQRTVYFNEIFKIYTEDFTPARASDLIAYVQRYAVSMIPADYQVAFTPYDWKWPTVVVRGRSRQESEPAPHAGLVAGKFSAEPGGQHAFFGLDLKARDVGGKCQWPKQPPR